MESAKLRALIYADIFDYPLTAQELEKWKIKDKFSSLNFQFSIFKTDGYYYLKGRKNLVALRRKREKISKLKEVLARSAAQILGNIPTTKMIAITGGLAMRNSEAADDIDLLVITQQKMLWLTRALCTLLLDIYNLRRKPNEKTIKDKICLNMFLEDDYLTLPKREQDLYGAHEVYQIKPLFDRDNTYEHFLKANNWARKFLPNVVSIKYNVLSMGGKANAKYSILYTPYYILEFLAKYFQLWYMRKRCTKEVIIEHMLRFHPNDFRSYAIFEYEKGLKKYGKI